MAKKGNTIDNDLQELYTLAKKHLIECPHCKEKVELGGDFAELKAAMELRLKYEDIKRKPTEQNVDEIPSALRDEEVKP